jgi:hypothetical protein
VAHIYLIHIMASVVLLVRSYPASLVTNPFFAYPEQWGFGLPVIYAVWVLTVLLLYPACRWYAEVKARRRDLWWLGYL